MGGQVRLVHITTLNGVSLAWFLSVSARGAGFPSSWGARPIRLPSRPRAVLPIVVVAFAAVCSTFLRIGWLCAAPECRSAFLDSLCARYARVRILCARAGAVCVRVSRCGVVVRVVL